MTLDILNLPADAVATATEGAVVTDSPVETQNNPLSEDGAGGEQTLDPNVETATGQTPPGETQPAVPPEPSEIDQLSEQFGYDFSGFSSPDDARAAARLMVERFAQDGFSYLEQQQTAAPPAAPPPQQPTPAQPAQPEDVSFDFDEDEVSPKVAKAIKALHAQQKQALQQAQQEIEQLRTAQMQSQQQDYSHQAAEISRRAESAIDALASPRYGTGQHRTFAQKMAANNVMQTAGAIIAGMTSRGQPVPVIEKVIEMAVSLHEPQASKPAPKAVPHTPQPSARAGVSAAGQSGHRRYIPPQHDPFDMLSDPKYRTALEEIMNR